jgi:hypothetical protein
MGVAVVVLVLVSTGRLSPPREPPLSFIRYSRKYVGVLFDFSLLRRGMSLFLTQETIVEASSSSCFTQDKGKGRGAVVVF